MRWQDRDPSQNVEDRRGQGGGFFGGGSGGGLRLGGGASVFMVIVVMVAGMYGIDLSPILIGSGALTQSESGPSVAPEEEREMARFSSVALKTTEETWSDIFQKMGRIYNPPRMVLYSGGTSTGCGFGQSAMGPFYCPEDETVYLDVSFYQDLKDRMGGGGDFAQGYVLAHEVGHHVQHLLGIDRQVAEAQQSGSRALANRLSVRLELQADCFAGVWGRAMQQQGILDPGDLQEALATAEAIGDDRLQQQSMGRVVPDSFTHGTSQQRYYWFKRGFDSGDFRQCDTFSD